MSKYFQPVEFEIPKDPDLPRQTTTIWHADKVAAAAAEIKAEVGRIKSGTSQYSTYAVDPGRFGFPAINALNAFVQNPTDKLLKNFEDTANSTFGARAGRDFTTKLRTAREVKDVT